jgi:hypothetical protein
MPPHASTQSACTMSRSKSIEELHMNTLHLQQQQASTDMLPHES